MDIVCWRVCGMLIWICGASTSLVFVCTLWRCRVDPPCTYIYIYIWNDGWPRNGERKANTLNHGMSFMFRCFCCGDESVGAKMHMGCIMQSSWRELWTHHARTARGQWRRWARPLPPCYILRPGSSLQPAGSMLRYKVGNWKTSSNLNMPEKAKSCHKYGADAGNQLLEWWKLGAGTCPGVLLRHRD